MVSPLTLSLNCVSQPLDSLQCLVRKHSLRARTSLSFATSWFMYVLLWDCLIVFVSTINTFTAHSFVELCVTTSWQIPIPWPEAFPPSSDSSQLCKVFIYVRAFMGLFDSVCCHYRWSHHSRFRWIVCHNLSTDSNTLTGSIPSELGQLTALQYLWLGTCFWGIVW